MLAVLLLLGLSIVLSELYLSLVYTPSWYGRTYYTLRKNFAVYQYDRQTGYRMSPNLVYSNPRKAYPNAPRKKEFVDVRTDRHGFLFTEDIDQLVHANYKLLFCIGGSTTAGMESAHAKTYPAQLDKLLRPMGYRSINAGLGGARSVHEKLIFQNIILKYKPAAVIIFSGYNDYEAYGYKVYAPYNPYVHYLSPMLARNPLESVLSRSSLYFFARRRWGRKSPVMADDAERFQEALEDPRWLEEWKNNMRNIIDSCHTHGIKCFFLSSMIPAYEGAPLEAKQFADRDLDMGKRFDQWVRFLEIIHGAARELCGDGRAQFIDVRPWFEKYLSRFDRSDYFKERFQLFVDRAHFSEKGNQWLAQAVYEQIKDKL